MILFWIIIFGYDQSLPPPFSRNWKFGRKKTFSVTLAFLSPVSLSLSSFSAHLNDAWYFSNLLNKYKRANLYPTRGSLLNLQKSIFLLSALQNESVYKRVNLNELRPTCLNCLWKNILIQFNSTDYYSDVKRTQNNRVFFNKNLRWRDLTEAIFSRCLLPEEEQGRSESESPVVVILTTTTTGINCLLCPYLNVMYIVTYSSKGHNISPGI